MIDIRGLDSLSLTLGIVAGTVIGIMLTVAATLLAAFISDWREMRRVQGLVQMSRHEWEKSPPAQSQPSPLTPLPETPPAQAAMPRTTVPLSDLSPETQKVKRILQEGRERQQNLEIPPAYRPKHLNTGEIPVPLAHLRTDPETDPRFRPIILRKSEEGKA